MCKNSKPALRVAYLSLYPGIRFIGPVFHWFLFHSNIPGSVSIGPGLRLPHPQNIIIARYASLGEFRTIYQNVTIAWNGFLEVRPHSPAIRDRVLIGAGATIIGDVVMGDDVLIGAGTVVSVSVPSRSRVRGARPLIERREPSQEAALAGSPEHLGDPYSIWRRGCSHNADSETQLRSMLLAKQQADRDCANPSVAALARLYAGPVCQAGMRCLRRWLFASGTRCSEPEVGRVHLCDGGRPQ